MLQVSGTDAIRPLHGTPGIEQAADHHRRERRTTDEGIDTVEAPASNDRLQHAARVAGKLLAAPERQCIGPAQYQVVADIEIRIAPIQAEVKRILNSYRGGVPAGIIQAVGEGVSALEIETAGEPVDVSDLERIER